ncbi:unnamed protein product [Effrenium voratum]|uniref:EF-hand domain-containing protein n=1 Tax=Effrenium voratum TaxID=2562239 RepID=A0AA36MI73_9DINO|nr:unnamed protein product [Effrenium voratum]CAJ1372541.1 unnamed protein product [Effrenium voratum]
MGSAPMRADARSVQLRDPQAKSEGREGSEGSPSSSWWCCLADVSSDTDFVDARSIVGLLRELFELQDLNSNGFLEESELIELNLIIASLHYGNVDDALLHKKYQALFRQNLDPHGKPVPFRIFRQHMMKVLDDHDPDTIAQEMIVEQFIAEAQLARKFLGIRKFC